MSVVHIYNLQNGIQDCSRGGAYHNKIQSGRRSPRPENRLRPAHRLSITEPTEALCEFVIEQGWDDINMNRIESSYTPRGKGQETPQAATATPEQPQHQICLPLLWKQRKSHQSGAYHVYGL